MILAVNGKQIVLKSDQHNVSLTHIRNCTYSTKPVCGTLHIQNCVRFGSVLLAIHNQFMNQPQTRSFHLGNGVFKIDEQSPSSYLNTDSIIESIKNLSIFDQF